MRQDGHGTLTLEDARTWIEETGLCLFLPRRQFSSSIAPSFVEAVAGECNATPDQKQIAVAEDMLVRLELDGVVVRLNLLGEPGEQPDFVVAAWVLPYVYALRGDRDWRRTPQLTGSRQVSQLAVVAYKQLEIADATIAELTRSLGQEVTENAVLRAITELWQQLRIIPVVSAPGQAAKWQLLRQRFQKAIAEGASTSQVTAISVLASIYLQAVIAAPMEDVEVFLAPLTARSKIREVLRGLVATRQVHTISMGHAPHFYVAGTLPEFAAPPTIYSSSSMPASAYFLRSSEQVEYIPEYVVPDVAAAAAETPASVEATLVPAEPQAPRPDAPHKSAFTAKTTATRPHFSRPATHSRDRKPAQMSSGSHPARRSSSDSRPSGARATNVARSASSTRWNSNSSSSSRGAARPGTSSGSGARSNRSGSRPTNSASGARTTKSSAPAWNQHSRPTSGAKSSGKPTGHSSHPRPDSRSDSRSSHSSRKPALTASAAAGNNKRFGFTAPPRKDTKKLG
jgi:uncharacterized membrane protein YgcG